MNFTDVDKNLKSLALELKDACDSKGVEINPSQSAKTIHKIGLEHLKLSPDKISLIRSVGLLNSALAREPNNASEIKNDLSKVCQHILEQANASRQTANLVQHAKYVKLQIESMRAKTNKTLDEMKLTKTENQTTKSKAEQRITIKSMKNIQQRISTNYKQIMIKLYQYCVDVLGPPPCKFAVVGMGSLARKEITPYSDFEHIILLEILADYEMHLEYFRWFSVIFHIIILNLQESIIPSLNIKYLNDKTCDLGDWFFDTYTSGVSFDGMMPHACKFPLGRTQPTEKKPWTTELIKPVDKMLEYLGSEENLKNGYHLRDILTDTCFVYGEQTLHDQFLNGIQSYKNSKTSNEIHDELRKQVKEDLDQFATRLRLVNLKPTKQLNIKQLFYRTSTLFVTALGKMCNIDSSSCFDIIAELAEQKNITNTAKHKLSLAVAIACKIRLGIYMKEKSQRDYIQTCNDSKTIFDDILDVIDVDSIVSYFQITYCLQLEVIKILGIKGSHIYSNVKMLNIAICYALRLDHLMLALSEDIFDKEHFEDSEFFQDYANFFEDDDDFSFTTLDSSSNNSMDSEINKNLSLTDDKHSEFTEDFTFFQEFANLFEEDGDSLVENSDFSDSNSIDCQRYETSTDRYSKMKIEFSLFDESVQDLEEKLSNVSKFLSIPDADLNLEHDLFNLRIHILNRKVDLLLDDYEEDLEFWERYLDISQRWFQTNKCQNLKTNMFFLLGLIRAFAANCLVELNRFEEALVHLNQFLTQPLFQPNKVKMFNKEMESIQENRENMEQTFVVRDIIWGHLISGGILFKMKNFEKSFHHLQVSFSLKLSLDKDQSLYFLYYNGIGSCLVKMKQYEHALVYLKLAFKYFQDDLHDNDDDDDKIIATKFEINMLPEEFQKSASFRNLNNCLLKLQKFEKVFVNLEKTLEFLANWKLNWEIEEYITLLKKKRMKTLAITLREFGLWFQMQNYFEEAVTYFQNSLSIHQKLNETKEISSTCAKLLQCHMQIYQREKSEKVLKDFYQSKKNLTIVATVLTTDFDVDNAFLYHFRVGDGLLKMKHYEKALEFFKSSLAIAMSEEFLRNKMHSIMLYNSIGVCLISMLEYEESLIYFKLAEKLFKNFEYEKKFEEKVWKSTLHLATSFHRVGKCFIKLGQFEKSLPYLDLALKIFLNRFDIYDDSEALIYLFSISVSHTKMLNKMLSILFDIGFCYMQQNRYEKAKDCFQESLSIHKKLLVPKTDIAIAAATRRKLLTCYMEMYQRERVEKHIKDLHKSGKKVIVFLIVTRTVEVDNTVLFGSYCKVGYALLKKKQFDKSLSFLKISLGGALSRKFDGCGRLTQVMLYSGIGTCLMNLEEYKEALLYFKLAIRLINKRTMADDDYSSTSSFNLTSTFHNVGKCFMKISQFKKALLFLYESLELVTECNVVEEHDLLLIGLAEKFPSYARRPQELANVLCDLATCLMKQNSFEIAVFYFERSFNLLKKLSKPKNVAAVRDKLLTCYMEIYQRDRAKKHIE